MTTIVGVQGDGWAVLASDNQTTYGETAYRGEKHGKIKKFGTVAIATAGDAIGCQILRYVWKPLVKPSYKDPDLYLVETLIPSMRSVLDNNGYDVDKKHEKDDDGLELMIVVGTRLYLLASDFTFMNDRRGIYGAGSGSPYAMGFLWANKTTLFNTSKRACSLSLKAVRVAMEFDINTGGDVDVLLME